MCGDSHASLYWRWTSSYCSLSFQEQQDVTRRCHDINKDQVACAGKGENSCSIKFSLKIACNRDDTFETTGLALAQLVIPLRFVACSSPTTAFF